MKKLFAVLLALVLILSCAAALAEAPKPTPMPEASGVSVKKDGDLTIDCSNSDQGYVMVKAKTSDKRYKLRVTTGSTSLNYDLNNEGLYETFPLQFGSGKYQIELYRNISGKKYKPAGSISISVKMGDELDAFLYPNQYLDYNVDTAAVEEAGRLCSGVEDASEIWTIIRSYVKDNFAYDYTKAAVARTSTGVLPDINGCWEKHMGICQDLSAVTIAMLRSQGVPARLMIGTLNEEYHAWVSANINGEEKWFDPTASLMGQKYSAKEYKVERYY